MLLPSRMPMVDYDSRCFNKCITDMTFLLPELDTGTRINMKTGRDRLDRECINLLSMIFHHCTILVRLTGRGTPLLH
jgi:hypothetical protein